MKRRNSEQLELLQTVGVCTCGHESCNHIGVFPHRQCIEDACECRSYVAAGTLTRPPATSTSLPRAPATPVDVSPPAEAAVHLRNLLSLVQGGKP